MMYDFILFFRDSIAQISGMLDSFYFNFGGIHVSIFDLFVGFIAMGIVISVFWKGART